MEATKTPNITVFRGGPGDPIIRCWIILLFLAHPQSHPALNFGGFVLDLLGQPSGLRSVFFSRHACFEIAAVFGKSPLCFLSFYSVFQVAAVFAKSPLFSIVCDCEVTAVFEQQAFFFLIWQPVCQ